MPSPERSARLMSLQSGDVWAEVDGTGPAVVFVHGLGGTSNVFAAQVRSLAADYSTVCFDLRGHGMSPLAGDVSIASWASDIEALLDQLSLSSATIVAHSLGTLVAQRLASTRPDLVDGLVLLGPIRDLADAARDAQRARAAVVRADGMGAVAQTIAFAATSNTTQAEQPSVTAFVKELLQRQSPEGYARACEALGSSTPPDMTAFSKPVLLVTGSDDAVSPAARINELSTAFNNVRVHIIDGIGHWTSIEAANDVNEQLASFLSAINGPQT
jgi:3-oxoadipate enol-lactonase